MVTKPESVTKDAKVGKVQQLFSLLSIWIPGTCPRYINAWLLSFTCLLAFLLPGMLA